MGASTRRRLGAALSGLMVALVTASPVLGREDPAPPWDDAGLAVLALVLIPVSALLAAGISRGHRRRA